MTMTQIFLDDHRSAGSWEEVDGDNGGMVLVLVAD